MFDNMNLNISGTLNVFRLLFSPSLCLPHATVSTFNQLPIPISRVFVKYGEKEPDIRAVVLDKDNCFAKPHENVVFDDYKVWSLFLCCLDFSLLELHPLHCGDRLFFCFLRSLMIWFLT
jgi:hypothetical protein